jgi:mono/diheme cytochrome c family protein
VPGHRLKLILACLLAAPVLAETPDHEKGKAVFQACRHCHNVLTDARKAGPSLRTLFGKVRLVNGKRATEQNVVQLITDGYNGMPSYRYILRPEDWTDLMPYLKSLRARPEIAPVLKIIRGSDEEVLATGRKIYADHCGSCHDRSEKDKPELLSVYRRETLSTGEPVEEATLVPRIREGHAGMPAKKDVLDDAALFALIAFLRIH